MRWLSVVGRGVLAFGATNIDDIFVLTLFYAQRSVKHWQVVVGQYLGITGLVLVSLAGYFSRFVIPTKWIGLLGLFPIAIGLKKLLEWKFAKVDQAGIRSNRSAVFTLAPITFANGGDNIAVYAPLFARSDIAALVLTVITFSVLIFVWCLLGYWLGSHPD